MAHAQTGSSLKPAAATVFITDTVTLRGGCMRSGARLSHVEPCSHYALPCNLGKLLNFPESRFPHWNVGIMKTSARESRRGG